MMQLNALHSSAIPLGELLPDLGLPVAIAKLIVSGMTIDSRQLNAGELFIALVGDRVNGQQFISAAIARGAIAILIESTLQLKTGSVEDRDGIPIIAVANLAERVSELASRCYGDPSKALSVIGVTGTNGKSTCVSLIAQIHNLLGGRAATVGTLGVEYGDVRQEFGMTTPDPVLSQKLLKHVLDAGADLVAMEVSSHGLDQNRVSAIQFSAGVFTNISHDHLDYHGSLQQYAAAKQKLFEAIGLRNAIINLDDPFAPQMVAAAKSHATVLSYSMLHFVADVYASDAQYSTSGVEFHLTTPWGEAEVCSPLLGEFNVYNLLAAVAALVVGGASFPSVLAAIPKLVPVPGRMQKIAAAGDLMAVVDYAHTPDALAQAIAAARVHTSGELWVIFGCGGDRDRSKRPAMAKIAERFADHVVVTSDNPRSEVPENIIAQVCAGFNYGGYQSFVDRAEAIYFATQSAKSGDVILIAGKGHEKFQIIGTEKRPFDDVTVAKRALYERELMSAKGVIS